MIAVATLGGAALQPASDRGLASITAADVARRVGIIAHDSMQGRATPSRGLNLTAEYIAREFRRMGLRAGGDAGTYLQWYLLAQPPASAISVAGDATAPNVVGVVEGTDPSLASEFVVFSAHMDHVGVDPARGADSIFNGADDDASGTAGILELAEAFSQEGARTRRSLLFLAVSGEERGLLGSEAFARHGRVPVDRIIATVNIDMIGRNWRDTIVAVGKAHSDLGATLDRVAAAHPDLGLAAVDDLWPQENFFVRSDHYNFARRGVPALFFFNGTHQDYHQPSDSPDKIDADKEARVLRLIYLFGREVANADARPTWNAESYRRIVGR
jgi:Zn-dependent M28 family amino/carboxypeptidase